jgi:hypothetical protein
MTYDGVCPRRTALVDYRATLWRKEIPMPQPTSSVPPPFDPQQPTYSPPRSSGLAWKILLGLLGGGLVLVVVCAGVGYLVFRNAMQLDPEKIRASAQEIAIVDMPDYFHPTMSMSIFGVRMVMFDGEDGRGALALVDAMDQVRQDRATFEKEMRQEIAKRIARRFDDEETERRNESLQIKGEPVEMVVVESEGADGTIFHEISGSFEGSENLAFIYVKVPDDQLTLDQLRQMIESIE